MSKGSGSGCVYVGIISWPGWDWDVEDVEAEFSAIGEIAACQILYDRHSKESMGQAKIVYFFPECVQKARKAC